MAGDDPDLRAVLGDNAVDMAERLAARSNGHRQNRPTVWDVQDLKEQYQPEGRSWTVPNFLGREERILFVGEEGAGKSWLSASIAVQAAAGLPILGTWPMFLPQRVVYVDLEQAFDTTVRMFRTLCLTAKFKDRDSLRIVHREEGVDLASPRERKVLMDEIGEHRPELLIVDPLYKLSITDGIYEREVKPTLRFLDHFRAEFGASIILVHHPRKSLSGEANRLRSRSDIIGSSVLLRWPETILFLNQQRFIVNKDRSRTFMDTRSWPVRWGGTWPISLGDPVIALDEEVFETIRDSERPISSSRLAREIRRSKVAVVQAAQRLAASGKITRRGNGWVEADDGPD